MSRQQYRKFRLLELEKEQYLDDAEGLVLTEDQRQLLLGPFDSVKFEFHDLDGLRWTQTALRRYQVVPSCHHPSLPDPSFLVLPDPKPSIRDFEATIRRPASDIRPDLQTLRKPSKSVNRNSSIVSPRFWHADSQLDDMVLRFPVPPSAIPPLPSTGMDQAFVGGLGFTNPITEPNVVRYTTAPEFYDSVIYSTPSSIRSLSYFHS